MKILTAVFFLFFASVSKSYAAGIYGVDYEKMSPLGIVVVMLAALSIVPAVAGGVYSLFMWLFEDMENTMNYWQGKMKKRT